MEDPLRSESPFAYHRCASRRRCRSAAGEQYATKWEFREVIENDLIDYARIDLCIVGGITEARKITGWCETHYIKLVTHNPLGPVSSAACLQVNLACPNFGVQEQPRRPGTDADRRRPGPGGVGGRLPAAADPPWTGHRVRPRGRSGSPFQIRADAP